MWDRWKKKIQNFIWKEVEDNQINHQENEDQEQTQSIQARMVYQYPDKKSFRFPVIPDQLNKPEATDIPAFRRRKNEQPIREKKPEQQQEQLGQQNNQRKVYKKDIHVPFKPSTVASPIYGFQKRKKEEEVENIPAFIRKQQAEDEIQQDIAERMNRESIEQKQAVPEEDKVHAEPAVVSEQEYIPEEMTTGMNKDNIQKKTASILEQEFTRKETAFALEQEYTYEETAAVVEQEHIPEEKIHTDNYESNHIYDSKPIDSPIKSQTESKNEQSNHSTRPRRDRGDRNTNQKQLSTIPFNVIMTPRDKKNLLDKQKAEESKKERQHRTVPLHLLNDPLPKSNANQLWVMEQQAMLEKTLKYFNVRAKVVNATQGPSVTRFEVQPELGVKVSKVRNLSDDIKLNMAARDIRIEAPIPGKNTIGIEVPNKKAQMVGLQEIFETNDFIQSTSPLTIALGLSIEGSPVITNIQKMPHGLIAGATGSGKSVCINTILVSLLYKASHEDVKFLLIDPKMVELAPYNGIPHLVSPVITDVKAATVALKWAVSEMEDRYDKFVKESVRDIERYNQKMEKQGRVDEKMPFLVIVIDELADLMMVSPQDVEDAICRIAQKARACGIHLLLATQRPSVDVITGLIKANIPTRIAFSVSSQVDSRTIIDVGGAEKLLGKGDMLFIENGAGKSIRLQGPFVSDDEIERITNHVREIAPPDYLFEQDTLLEQITMEEDEDELLQDAIQFVIQQNGASTSLLQRHFKIGYNRAARLIDTLENRGIISGQNGSKPRDVLITKSHFEEKYG